MFTCSLLAKSFAINILPLSYAGCFTLSLKSCKFHANLNTNLAHSQNKGLLVVLQLLMPCVGRISRDPKFRWSICIPSMGLAYSYTQSCWWLNHLSEKNMLVKLDHETPNFRDSFSNRKKIVKFHHHSHVILTIQKINEFTLIKANLPILPWLFCGGYGGTPNQRPAGNSACSKDWLKASPLVELEEALEEDELGWWQVGWIFFQGNWEVRWLVEFWKACHKQIWRKLMILCSFNLN